MSSKLSPEVHDLAADGLAPPSAASGTEVELDGA